MGYGESMIQKYENGSGYVPYNDQTPGSLGILNPGDGFWYGVTDSTLVGAKMLIPAKPYTGAGISGPQAPDYGLFAGVWKVLQKVSDFVIAPAYAGKNDERRKAQTTGKEWYVRLIAEWPEGNLKDSGNTLGQLVGSEKGYDTHDLKELSPFGAPYLTIVFPHADWGDRSGNYASDFHPLVKGKGKNRGDIWSFEVRTDQPGREITLRWVMQGKFPKKPWLVNVDTGEVVEIDTTVPGSYTFIMSAATGRFEWSY